MVTIPQIVIELVREKPFLEELIADGLINLSALARQLIPEIEKALHKEVKEGAVIMALKRMPLSINQKVSFKLDNVIQTLGDITVRSNLTDFTFQNSDTIREKEKQLMDLMMDWQEAFYTISRGVYETTLVVNNKFEDNVFSIFDTEKLISSTRELASVTIRMPKENLITPGLYYFIFKRLAEHGINVVEVVSTSNEITIIVLNSDVEKAFSVTKNLA